MDKILANDGIDNSAKEALEAKGFMVSTQKVEADQLIETLNAEQYAVLIIRSATKVTEKVLREAKYLKLVIRAGVGLDNIDLQAAESCGIQVNNTPAASSQAVAEWGMAAMFTLARKMSMLSEKMPSKGHQEFKSLKKAAKGMELSSKTLGIVGFGRIGRTLASYALGMGMQVHAHDPFIKETKIEVPLNITGHSLKAMVSLVEQDVLFSSSDFISLHVPKGDKPLIDANVLSKMKSSAFLLNAARGGVVDEFALLDALDKAHIAGAALDVFENEPHVNSALLKHPKIFCTPHIGASTIEAQKRIGDEIVSIIDAFNVADA